MPRNAFSSLLDTIAGCCQVGKVFVWEPFANGQITQYRIRDYDGLTRGNLTERLVGGDATAELVAEYVLAALSRECFACGGLRTIFNLQSEVGGRLVAWLLDDENGVCKWFGSEGDTDHGIQAYLGAQESYAALYGDETGERKMASSRAFYCHALVCCLLGAGDYREVVDDAIDRQFHVEINPFGETQPVRSLIDQLANGTTFWVARMLEFNAGSAADYSTLDPQQPLAKEAAPLLVGRGIGTDKVNAGSALSVPDRDGWKSVSHKHLGLSTDEKGYPVAECLSDNGAAVLKRGEGGAYVVAGELAKGESCRLENGDALALGAIAPGTSFVADLPVVQVVLRKAEGK